MMYEKRVYSDLEEGSIKGITGTATFFVSTEGENS
jgi:hypothetical protein